MTQRLPELTGGCTLAVLLRLPAPSLSPCMHSELRVFFTYSMYFVNESESMALVTVEASGVSQEPYTVTISVNPGTATCEQTCVALPSATHEHRPHVYLWNIHAQSHSHFPLSIPDLDDYNLFTFDFTFEPGTLDLAFGVPILDDSVAEGSESILLEIFVSTEALNQNVLPGEPIRSQVIILDDDGEGTCTARLADLVMLTHTWTRTHTHLSPLCGLPSTLEMGLGACPV